MVGYAGRFLQFSPSDTAMTAEEMKEVMRRLADAERKHQDALIRRLRKQLADAGARITK